MKEFRSLLAFAEFSQRPILAVFSEGGAPMSLSVSQGPFLTSTYVLATLEGDEILSEASQPTLATSPSGAREGAPASQLTPVSSVSSSQQAEIERLIESGRRRIEDMTIQQDRIEDLEQQLDEKTKENESLKENNKKLMLVKKKWKRKYDVQKGLAEATQRELSHLQMTVASLREERKSISTNADMQRKKIRCLTKALGLKNAEVRRLKFRKKLLLKSNKSLTTKLTSQEEALAKVSEEKKTLEETNTELSRCILTVKSLLLEDSDSDISDQ